MGFKREGNGNFRLKCNNCGKSELGHETIQTILINKGWQWLEMRVSVKGQDRTLSRATCPYCKWDATDIIEEMKEAAFEEEYEGDLRDYNLLKEYLKFNGELEIKLEESSDDAKQLEKAITGSVDGCSGAMYHAVLNAVMWIRKNSWEEYVETLMDRNTMYENIQRLKTVQKQLRLIEEDAIEDREKGFAKHLQLECKGFMNYMKEIYEV